MSSNEAHFGSLDIDGHAYPADPSSAAFTDLLMDCFQRGRGIVAARQIQSSSPSHLKGIKSEPIPIPRVKPSKKSNKRRITRTQAPLKKKKANLQRKHA